MDDNISTELEAAAFRRLLNHLNERTDVQNIDLMNLAGFCRNCLSKWFMVAAKERQVEIDYDEARAIIYGEAYAEWKNKFQSPANEEQKQKFEETKPFHAKIN